MPNTVLTHTVIEDKAQTVINDYVRTKEILTEKMNAHDEVIAKILNDHEQSVTDFTEKIDDHTKKLNIHGKAIEDALIKIDAWKELNETIIDTCYVSSRFYQLQPRADVRCRPPDTGVASIEVGM